MVFWRSFIELITVPVGGLVYHLVTLLAIHLILGVTFERWNRRRRDPTAIRLLVTGVGFAFARTLLIFIAVLDRARAVSPNVILPPLERFLDLTTLLLVAWAFLPVLEQHARLGVTLLLFTLLVTAGVYVAFAILWPLAEVQGIAYNDYWQETVWEFSTIVVLVLALIASVAWRQGRSHDRRLIICLFALWLTGHVLQITVPVTDPHIAGWVRWANLAALPLLAGLVYRRSLSVPPAAARDAAGVRSWLRWGVSAVRAGDYAEARRCFQTARDVDPDNVVALLWLAWLAHTRLESLVLFSHVLELEPKNESAHTGIRWARRRPSPDGRYDDLIAAGRLPTAIQRPEAISPPGLSFLRDMLRPSEIQGGIQREGVTLHTRWLGSPAGMASVFLRFTWRLLPTPALLVVLVFFVALTVNLGQEGGLGSLPVVAPSAAGFTIDYLANLVQGDLGVVAPLYPSASTPSVAAKLARALPRSLGLLTIAMTLAIIIGLPLGIGAGLRRKTGFSGLLVFLSVLGISTPSYFAAMLLIWFDVWLYRTTGTDFLPVHGFGWDAHLILPALVLAARPAANVMRLGYNALVDVLDTDFVRTAHAKGLGPWVVLFRHVLRATGVPLLTTVAVSLRFSLAILPIVEYIFNWAGVGQGLLEAVQAHDTTTVIGMVLPLALLFILVNLLLEALYLVVDPRLRAREAGAV